MIDLVFVLIGTIIGSLSCSSVLLYVMKRRDKVETLVVHNNRLGTAVELIMETQMVLIDALSEQNILNGEGRELKRKIHEYMMESTTKGFAIKDN